MIQVQSISAAVFLAISSYAPLVNSGYRVEHGAAINADPELTPWIGVWPGDLELEPQNLVGGIALTWRGTVEIDVYHQFASWQGSGDAVLGLKAGADAIMTIVGSDVPMKGTALMLKAIRSELFAVDVSREEAFFTGHLTFTYEVNG